MDNEFTFVEEKMICRMPEEIDHHYCGAQAERLDRLVAGRQVRQLVFDFSRTRFMDSSGIGFLIGRSRTMRLYGGRITAKNLQGRAKKLFCASGLTQLIRIEEEKEDE